MDVTTIAAFISLEVASGFLKESGKEIYHKVRASLTPEELITLDLLEQHPDNKELQEEVASKLKAHLETKPDMAEELRALLTQLPGFAAKRNAIAQTGTGNIALQDVHGSKIDISK